MAMRRIILHWTAGKHAPSHIDMQHYHFLIDGAGRTRTGYHKPEDNEETSDGDYAAHTGGCNTGAIGVAVCAMRGARERPFDPGTHPITPAQVDALVALVARLCREYGIPVNRETVLSHAEVQPTLGIRQAGKWDIAWLPGMESPGAPVAVGDRLRTLIRLAMPPDTTIHAEELKFTPQPWTERMWSKVRAFLRLA